MKIKKLVAGMVSVIGVCLAISTTCLAGGMNAAEASVYSAASGTFQYEGKTYKAASEYLVQLQAYLCRDDIDLSQDQATEAINRMYGSVAQGVLEGYIVPADGSSASTPATPENPGAASPTESVGVGSAEEPGTEDGNTDAFQPSEAGQSGSETIGTTDIGSDPVTDINKTAGGNSVVTSNGKIFGGLTEAQQKEMEDTLSTRAAVEEANGEISYDPAENMISVQSADGIVYHLPEDVNRELLGKWTGILKAVGIAMCVITVVCAILLFAFGCMEFQKKKPANSNHKLRRNLRKLTGILLSLVLGVGILGAGGTLWMRMSFFDAGRILESLSDSGYYHGAYDSMMKQVHAVMKVSGCREDTCDDILTYENFMFSTKNQIQLALQGRASSATYEDVKEDVVEALDGIEYFTKESREQLGSAILVIYQSSVKNVLGDVTYAVKNFFIDELKVIGILLMICVVISILLMVYSERYHHRGMMKIANAFFVAGILAALIGIWLFVGKPYAGYYITPDYLYLFVAYLVEHSVKILWIIAGPILGGGILLRLSAREMKKRIQR